MARTCRLTPMEFNILLLPGKATRARCIRSSRSMRASGMKNAIGVDNTVAVHIRHIREKIEINPKEPRYLKVVWGVGYKIEKQ